MIKAPFLALPLAGEIFVVYSDASHDDVGYVLMQGGKTIFLWLSIIENL